jgi:CHRD domain-containing protein
MEDDSMKTRTCLMVAVTLIGMFVASHALAQSAGPGRPPLFAVLLGGNEVSDDGQANAGDPDGVGSATVLFAATTLCFGLTVNNLDEPSAAHIHQERAGVNGPIVVPLTAPANGDPGASSGCIPDVDPDLVEEIRTHPGEFYVNVHTEKFPAGAIRGQLF